MQGRDKKKHAPRAGTSNAMKLSSMSVVDVWVCITLFEQRRLEEGEK